MANQQPVKDEFPKVMNADEEKSVLVQSRLSVVLHVILAAVVIILILVIAIIFRWIYRKRKYNRLRHYLIPTYTFDPNEEETWDADIDNQESVVFAGPSSQGYQSVEVKNNVIEQSSNKK